MWHTSKSAERISWAEAGPRTDSRVVPSTCRDSRLNIAWAERLAARSTSDAGSDRSANSATRQADGSCSTTSAKRRVDVRRCSSSVTSTSAPLHTAGSTTECAPGATSSKRSARTSTERHVPPAERNRTGPSSGCAGGPGAGTGALFTVSGEPVVRSMIGLGAGRVSGPFGPRPACASWWSNRSRSSGCTIARNMPGVRNMTGCQPSTCSDDAETWKVSAPGATSWKNTVPEAASAAS